MGVLPVRHDRAGERAVGFDRRQRGLDLAQKGRACASWRYMLARMT